MAPKTSSTMRKESPSNITKYCACQEKWRWWLMLVRHETSITVRGATGSPSNITKYCACHENSEFKIWAENLYCFRQCKNMKSRTRPVRRPWRRILYGKIQNFALWLSPKISRNAATATKSDTPTSPNIAPATKKWLLWLFSTTLYSTLFYSNVGNPLNTWKVGNKVFQLIMMKICMCNWFLIGKCIGDYGLDFHANQPRKWMRMIKSLVIQHVKLIEIFNQLLEWKLIKIWSFKRDINIVKKQLDHFIYFPFINRYLTLLYSILLYSTLLCSVLLHSTLLCFSLLFATLLHSSPTFLYSTLLYSILLFYSTLLYSNYSSILYSTLRNSEVSHLNFLWLCDYVRTHGPLLLQSFRGFSAPFWQIWLWKISRGLSVCGQWCDIKLVNAGRLTVFSA